MINVKRAYEQALPADGVRYLVDRLWPRGLSKNSLQIEDWFKDVAPSEDLRRWFGHDPDRWDEFRRRYFSELDSKPESWEPLLDAARKGSITLVYGARNTDHNNAVALAEYLSAHTRNKAAKRRR